MDNKKIEEYSEYIEDAKKTLSKLEMEKEDLISRLKKIYNYNQLNNMIELLETSVEKYQKLYDIVVQITNDLKKLKD